MTFDPQSTTEFFPVWKKYKPVIIKLMKDSLEGDQSYQLFGHEFADVNTKSTSTYSFKIVLEDGRVTNVKKPSKMALDLLSMIKQSPSGKELVSIHDFKFDLDGSFKLTVRSISKEVPEAKEAEGTEAAE